MDARDRFYWKLLTNTLSEDDLSEVAQSPTDMPTAILQTDICVANAYENRGLLRTHTTQQFIDLLDPTEVRQKAMELILQMSEDAWLAAIDAGEVPQFVRSKPGDADHVSLRRSPNVNSRDMYYLMYRDTLRETELEDFLLNGSIFA